MQGFQVADAFSRRNNLHPVNPSPSLGFSGNMQAQQLPERMGTCASNQVREMYHTSHSGESSWRIVNAQSNHILKVALVVPNKFKRNPTVLVFGAAMLVLLAGCVGDATPIEDENLIVAKDTSVPQTLITPDYTANATGSKPDERSTEETQREDVQDDREQKLMGPSYQDDVRPMFMGRCTQCHGYEPGRFDPHSYERLLGVVVPGKPDRSTFIQMMSFGHHAPDLKPHELEVVVEWILAGAQDN